MPAMVPTPRTYYAGNSGSGSTSRLKPTLEIIPTSRFIVFNGGEHEAATVKLSGVVRFTSPEPMSILKPKVRLEGKRKICWWYMGGISTGEVSDKRAFWSQEQKLGNLESTHKVKAGVIEWPFEFELSPSMPESVEGLRETYIAYHLCASVSRPGWNAKDVVAQEHVRIVRTLGAESMEMTRSRVNADIWANKIAYSISIPTDAIVFGTSITADVELSPIKKGLRLGKVELRLVETVVKRIQASELPDARGDRSKSEETEVAKQEMEFPEHSRILYDDETADNPMMADEMYKFKATLPLPKSLNVCRQDVDSHQINVSHRFKLMVNIHNPEGHVSQLVCRLPVKIFISPNLPVNEANEVCGAMHGMSDETLNNNETTVTAPPEYGRHMLDALFSDMDPAGYTSRGPSMPGSPSGLGAQSRRGSQDEMPSLNGVANGLANGASDDLTNGEGDDDNHGSASPSILRSRLADLQERGTVVGRSSALSFSYSPSGGNSPAPGMASDTPESLPRSNFSSSLPNGPSFFPNGPSSLPNSSSIAAAASTSSRPSRQPSRRQSPQPTDSSAGVSRRVSNEDESGTEVHRSDYEMASLNRVPSYGAALRTPHGTLTPFSEGPPTYVEATSRPPSPGIQRPGQAHVRSGAMTPGSAIEVDGGGRLPPAHHRSSSSAAADDEARARMRMLRART